MAWTIPKSALRALTFLPRNTKTCRNLTPILYMIPKATTATPHASDTKAASFDHVPEREALEESRYNVAVERLREEEVSAQQAMIESEKHGEEQDRAQANKELLSIKEEIGKELQQSQKEIAKEVEAEKAKINKRMPAVVDEQVVAALSLAA